MSISAIQLIGRGLVDMANKLLKAGSIGKAFLSIARKKGLSDDEIAAMLMNAIGQKLKKPKK